MLAGTGSDVGKSLIATGLCRIFLQDGYNPAPFKAQNMALNSYATPDGLEIGRAQAVQAEAAGIECSADMNPLLLKPSGDHTSQVVILGRPSGNRDAYEYFRREGREELRKVVVEAFHRLESRHNPVVMEGAGSISEINLRDSDLVNMPMAKAADAKVILVADIDRGGVFASVYGSVMLQSPEDRKRIAGIIVNKFRGDMRLFEEGRRLMSEITGVPVIGVVPFAPDIHIEEEDSVALSIKHRDLVEGKVNIAVIMLRHISNFTDFNHLEKDPRVNIFYTSNVDNISRADIIIIPGTKATIPDLLEIRQNGVASAIVSAHRAGKSVIGICGGYQIMGRSVSDPLGIEGEPATVPGLGLLPTSTVLDRDKVTRQVKFHFLNYAEDCTGYEIHQGRTVAEHNAKPLCHLSDGSDDGIFVSERCMGSYIHGILDNQPVIDFLIAPYSKAKSAKLMSYKEYKETQYDLLADHLRKYIDIKALYEIMEEKEND